MSIKKPIDFTPFVRPEHQILMLSLLRTSMSLSFTEKSKVINQLNEFSTRQIYELIAVFKDERVEFVEIAQKGTEDKILSNLIERTIQDWQEIETIYDMPELLSEEALVEQLELLQDKEPADYFSTLDRFLGYDKKSDWMMPPPPLPAFWGDDKNNEVDKDEMINPELAGWLVEDGDEETQAQKRAFLEWLLSDDDDKNDGKSDGEDNRHLSDDTHIDKSPKSLKKDKKKKKTKKKEKDKKPNAYNLLTTLSPNASLEEAFVHKEIELPADIVGRLKKTVIGQDEALEKLATTLYYHKLARMHTLSNTKKTNTPSDLTISEQPQKFNQLPIFLMGGTGTGKTHLIKSITEQYNIDCVVFDASTFVPTGIVGTSLDTLGRVIYEKAKENTQRAEHMVVFLDEFDKLFLNKDNHNNRLGVAVQLLTMLEGSMPMPVEHHNKYYDYPTHIKTDKMLFILSGSFNIQQNDQKRQPIGFHSPTNANRPHHQLSMTELGLPDEMAGRMGQVIALNTLSDDDYLHILYQSPSSPYIVLQNQLKLTKCTVALPEEVAKTLIADNQSALKTFGSRGLYQAFNQLPCITRIMLEATKASDQHFVIELS